MVVKLEVWDTNSPGSTIPSRLASFQTCWVEVPLAPPVAPTKRPSSLYR